MTESQKRWAFNGIGAGFEVHVTATPPFEGATPGASDATRCLYYGGAQARKPADVGPPSLPSKPRSLHQCHYLRSRSGRTQMNNAVVSSNRQCPWGDCWDDTTNEPRAMTLRCDRPLMGKLRMRYLLF